MQTIVITVPRSLRVFRSGSKPLIAIEVTTQANRSLSDSAFGLFRSQLIDRGYAGTSQGGRLKTSRAFIDVYWTRQNIALELVAPRVEHCMLISGDMVLSDSVGLDEDDEVEVLFTDICISSVRNASELRRKVSSRGFGANAKIIVSSKEIGRSRYAFVDSSGRTIKSVPVGASVILDQNVLIDLQLCARKSRQLPRDLNDALTTVRRLEVLPGHAIAEASSMRGQHVSSQQLLAAWNAWLSLTPGKIDAQEFNLAYGEELEQSSPETYPSLEHALSLSFMNLFEAVDIWRELQGKPFQSPQRLKAFKEWIGKINTSEGGMSGHIGQAVVKLLLGKNQSDGHENAAAFLKLAGLPPYSLAALRGAVYDAYYLTYLDMASAGQVESVSGNPVLWLTADAPAVIRGQERTLMPLVTNNSEGTVMGTLLMNADHLDHYSEGQRLVLKQIENNLQTAALTRHLSTAHNAEKLSARVKRLTKMLVADGVVVDDL